MSRRSSEFAHGVQKFSWRIAKFTEANGRERYKAECLNHPKIVGLGDDEQTALRAGVKAIQEAAEKVELGVS